MDDKILNDYAKKDLLESSSDNTSDSSGSCSDSSSCSSVEVLNNFSDTSIKQESSLQPENSCNTPNLATIRVPDNYFSRSPVSKRRRINLPVKIKKERGSYNYNSNAIALTSDEDDSECPGSQKISVYEQNMAHCRAIKVSMYVLEKISF